MRSRRSSPDLGRALRDHGLTRLAAPSLGAIHDGMSGPQGPIHTGHESYRDHDLPPRAPSQERGAARIVLFPIHEVVSFADARNVGSGDKGNWVPIGMEAGKGYALWTNGFRWKGHVYPFGPVTQRRYRPHAGGDAVRDCGRVKNDRQLTLATGPGRG